jgi:pyridoxine kinase
VTSALPTAVLSANTAFEGFTWRDLTEDIEPINSHWLSLGVRFDAVYSGFLASAAQIGHIRRLMASYPDALILVDPVMADNGRYYSVYDATMAAGMAQLCAQADIITPNLTEAAFLLGEEYCTQYGREYVEGLLVRLFKLGGKEKRVVITGISFDENSIGAAAYDGAEFFYSSYEKIGSHYNGTGDVFASVLLAAYMNGKSFGDSVDIAANFTSASIRVTAGSGSDERFGVNFEKTLHILSELLAN